MSNIHSSWVPLFDKYKIDIDQFYSNEGIIVYPSKELVYRVFEMDVNEIKIVLLGQDPYHKKDQAHGLSFSVPENIKIPPSLRNIFKELKQEFPDRNYEFKHGNLERWFNDEKIFLLNSSLSVIEGKAGSHMKLWENFTDNIIKYISENNDKCIFLLLGNYAKSKSNFIQNKNNIVSAPHPSPLARGFIGSNVFTSIENILNKKINWNI
jgi:uracil-DNA glycosylase